VNSVTNLRVPYNAGKLSSGLTTGGFWGSAQLRRVSSTRTEYFKLYLSYVQVKSTCENIVLRHIIWLIWLLNERK
jgi:hypothetical protein